MVPQDCVAGSIPRSVDAKSDSSLAREQNVQFLERIVASLLPSPRTFMPRILFVDDEPLILNSLRLRFGRRHPDWDCRFASDGAQALEPVEQCV